MQDRIEEILIDIYYTTIDGSWALLKLRSKEKKYIVDYVITKVKKNPIGETSVYYRLSPAGEVVVEFILRKYSREVKKDFGGLALEKRQWLFPQYHSIPASKVVDAFREIAKRGEIPIEVRKDWDNKRKRVILRDLDRGLSRISTDVGWEMDKNPDRLIHHHGFGEVTAWLWCDVLDKNRKAIRSAHFQQEFIVW